MTERPKRRGKFALLRDAFKAARQRAKENPTTENKAVAGYLENARVASILLSKMREEQKP